MSDGTVAEAVRVGPPGIKRWKYDFIAETVREVECDGPRYPAKDAEGDTLYDNTHFETAKEAWEKLLREHRACVELCERDRERAINEALKAADTLTAARVALTRARVNYNAYLDTVEPRGMRS